MSVGNRRRPIAPNLSSEDGAILPLVALLLVVLLGFAAIAIDLGFRWVSDRQAQTAADTAALTAAVSIFVDNGDLQGAVDEAIALANENTNWTITAADWAGCTDPDHLEYTTADLPTVTQATQCISFSGSFDEIRVRLPVAQLDTFIAGIIGFDSFGVSAAAQADLSPPGDQSTPPFVVLPPGNAGEEVCLRTSNNAPLPGRWIGNGPGVAPSQPLASEDGYVPDPCDDLAASPQFFGTLKPYFYTDINTASNPDTACKQINGSISYGIAEGIDHPLSSFDPDYNGVPTGPDVRIDGNGCPSGPPIPWPNTAELQSGFTAQVLKDGFLVGTTLDGITVPGRLQQGFHTGSEPQFAGRTMENRPLWTFLRPSISTYDVPDECDTVQANQSNGAWDYFDLKEEMIRCLDGWDASDDYLFVDDLYLAGRFAVIPVVAESSLGGSGVVHFNSFVPVYFQTLYQYGNETGSPDPMCFSQAEGATGNAGWYRHEAGQGFDCGRSNQNVDRVAALVLDCGMMSPETCNPDPQPGPGGSLVYAVRLTQ